MASNLAGKISANTLVYENLGRLFFSAGIVLICFLGIRIARESVDSQVRQHSNYLLIASTPVFELPPATPLPTLTPTPTPTATPPPLPAIRIAIPAIKVNSSIKEITPTEKTLASGEKMLVWEPLAFSVAHYNTSSNPGGGGNIVLSGHNNTQGEIFRNLNQLAPGDEIILYTEMDEFHYQVQSKALIPYLGAEAEANATLQTYSAPQPNEVVTIISCWPYATNASRIIIVAVPLFNGTTNGQ